MQASFQIKRRFNISKLPKFSFSSSLPDRCRGRSTSCLSRHFFRDMGAAIFFMAMAFLMVWMVMTAIGDGKVKPGPLPEQHLTKKEITRRMQYHGTLYAWFGQDGEWHFKRDGKELRLW